MTRLRGSLDGIGLAAIVRFLADLETSGHLRIWHGGWVGEVSFDRGQLVAAAFGSARGLAALDAILLALAEGRFAFAEGAPPDERNVEGTTDELLAYLEGVAAQFELLARANRFLATVPRVAEAPDRTGTAGEVVLDRSALATLLAVDGRRTIDELVGGGGLAGTIQDVATLVGLGLIRLDAPSESL